MNTVVIVEDNALVRRDLAVALERAGFVALGVGTLAAGRAALAGEARALCAAILDVRLPDGDGVELLAAIRTDVQLHDLPVIVLSTQAEVEDRLRGLRSGANDYLGKPYQERELLEAVHQQLAAR